MMKKSIPETNWLKIKQILIYASKSSTSHGLPKIFESKKKILKIFWSFFFLISFGYCSFSVIKTINKYLNWDYVTKIEVIQEIPTQFPAITICNLNIFGTDYAQNILNSILLKNKASLKNQTFAEAYHNIFVIQILFQLTVMSNNFTDENRKNLSLPLEDFLLFCRFGLSKCDANHFDWFYDKFYGNCFTINNGRNSKGEKIPIYNSTQGGNVNGLELMLYLGNQSNIPQQIPNSGVHVFVHNQSIVPISHQGLDVSSGEVTKIIISRLFETKLEYPYNDCKSNLSGPDQFDSDVFREIFKFRKSYSQNDCFEGCLQKEIIEKCKCYSPFFLKLGNIKNCENLTDVLCIFNIFEDFFKQDVNEKCSKYCPQICNCVIYSLTTSHSVFPNPKFTDFMINHPTIQAKFHNSKHLTFNTNLVKTNSINIDKDEVKKSIAMITIFYDDVKYTYVSQIPIMTFEELLSAIGGVLGLFIGVSFLSFFEIIDALIQIVFIFLDKNNKVFP